MSPLAYMPTALFFSIVKLHLGGSSAPRPTGRHTTVYVARCESKTSRDQGPCPGEAGRKVDAKSRLWPEA